jgi:hypothetical protein
MQLRRAPLACNIGTSNASINNSPFFLGIGSRLLLRLAASLFFLASVTLDYHLSHTIAAVSLRLGGLCLGTLYCHVLVRPPMGCQQTANHLL